MLSRAMDSGESDLNNDEDSATMYGNWNKKAMFEIAGDLLHYTGEFWNMMTSTPSRDSHQVNVC